MTPQLILGQGGLSIPVLLGAAAAIYLLVSYIRSYRRLSHFKGPLLAQLSYLWMFFVWRRGNHGEDYAQVVRDYAEPGKESLVRIGPNDLITDSPEIVRRMTGVRSTFRRSSWYKSAKVDHRSDNMLSLMDTAAHDKVKAMTAAGYAGKDNDRLEETIDEQLVELVALLRRKYVTRPGEAIRPVDFATLAQYFTLDSITSVAYGAPFGYLKTDSDVYGFVKTLADMIPMAVLIVEIPYVQALLANEWALRLFGPKPTDKTGVGKLLGVADRVAAERFRPGAEDRRDMLGSFVRHGLTERQCVAEISLQILAGSDTTATAIRGTLLHLCASPACYAALRAEIDSATATKAGGGRGLSTPVTWDEARALPYLQAVVYEGVRTSLPLTALNPKEVPEGGAALDDGRFLPAGTRVAVSHAGIQARADVFGADARLFRPQRWLECGPEARARMAATVELIFGNGRWMCAGKALAFMELNKIFVELLRNFDFQIVNPKKPLQSMDVSTWIQSDMWMHVTERTSAK